MEVVGDRRPRRVLADQRHESLLALDVNHLAIAARLYEDDPRPVRGRVLRRGVDRLLHGRVLAAAVRGDDRVRVAPRDRDSRDCGSARRCGASAGTTRRKLGDDEPRDDRRCLSSSDACDRHRRLPVRGL